MLTRLILGLTVAATLSACSSERLDPFAKHVEFRTHCRKVLNLLATRDPDKTRISIESTNAAERGEGLAVTIVYLQGESRRLITCLYNPAQPNRVTGGSYRGQALTPAQIEDINANAR